MESNFYTKILDETILEVYEPIEETIDKLRAQAGKCRETDCYGQELEFICTKKGKIRVENLSAKNNHSETSSRIYYVCGEVVEENEKTKVKIYSVHDKSTVIFRHCTIAIHLIVFAVYLFFVFSSQNISIKEIFGIFLFILLLLPINLLTVKEKQNKNTDLEIMKNEIIKRVEAIKRWDE